MSRLLLSALIVLCASCTYKYESVTQVGYKSGDLVHTVILKLKEDTDQHRIQEVIAELQSLSSIEETKCLQVAAKAQTIDPRAKIDYDLILQMAFESIEDLESYGANSFHLEVRRGLKNDLAQAPVVYDYWVQ
ncbi:MAG: Dabb family protein [Flavobacteriales bacterium]